MAMNQGEGGLARLGAWAARRSEPRLWVSIAGAGCLLAVTGLLAIAGDAQVEDSGDTGSTAPGIILFLLVVAAGYALLHFAREAPAASAGVTAVVLGLPPLMYFLTFDESDLPPFSLEAVLGASALVWIVSYMVGPGRGRPLLLGAGLVFAWLFVLQVVEDPFSGLDQAPIISEDPFGDLDAEPYDEQFDDDFGASEESFPGDDGFGDDDFGSSGASSDSGFDDFDQSDDQFGGGGGGEPSWSTLGIISLLFGVGYLVAARRFDHRRFAGTATPFVVAGHIALPTGIVLLSEDLEMAGTGVAFVIAGGLVAWVGALSGRRATTIIGAIEVIIGLYLVVGDAMQDSSATSFGTALFVLGAVLVGAAHLLHIATGEPPQTTPGPSSFGGRPSRTVPASTWAPTPAGPYAPVTGNAPPAGPPAVAPGPASGGPGTPGGPPPLPPLPPPPPPPGPGGSAF
jgi:hypothetical protein